MSFLFSVLALLIAILLMRSIRQFWQNRLENSVPPATDAPLPESPSSPRSASIAPSGDADPAEPAIAPAATSTPTLAAIAPTENESTSEIPSTVPSIPAVASEGPLPEPQAANPLLAIAAAEPVLELPPALDDPQEEPQAQPEAEERMAIAPVLNVQPPPLPDMAAPEIPFATSLTVSELVQPVDEEFDVELQRVGEELVAIAKTVNDPKALRPHHTPNLLEEMADLEGHDQQIAHLWQHLSHPDANVRLAAAAFLGELAHRTHSGEREEIITILNQCLQDSDLEVRTRAATLLAEM